MLTVAITAAVTAASTIVGMWVTNRGAAARLKIEMEDRERQRNEEGAERERQRHEEVEEKRREWVRETLLAPLAEERRKAHAELCAFLWTPRSEAETSAPIEPNPEEIQSVAKCLAHIDTWLAHDFRQWAADTRWGTDGDSNETRSRKRRLIEELAEGLSPATVMKDDPIVKSVIGKPNR